MADTIEIVIKRKAHLPDELVDKKTMETVGDVVSASILQNIQKQQTATGARIKTNSAKTRERKRRLGRRLLSLVDEKHRFVRGKGASWKRVRATNTSVMVVPATDELRKLSGYVQAAGYVGWYGINRIAKKAIQKLLRQAIEKKFREAARRG